MAGRRFIIAEIRAAADELRTTAYVVFPGYISDRKKIFQVLQDADVFLFCHQTPESPRCLVEALASGCPLVGYGSAYPREIIAQYGGGIFVTPGDWEGVVKIIQNLDQKSREAS